MAPQGACVEPKAEGGREGLLEKADLHLAPKREGNSAAKGKTPGKPLATRSLGWWLGRRRTLITMGGETGGQGGWEAPSLSDKDQLWEPSAHVTRSINRSEGR